MQQYNTIETKLQQLESQQLPDLSQMDNHWQQMQAMLQPATAITKKKYWPWLVVAACFLGIAVWVITLSVNSKESTQTIIAEKKRDAPAIDTVPRAQMVQIGDTIKLIYPPILLKGTKSLAVSSKKSVEVAPARRTDTVYFNLNFIDCKDSTVKTNTVLVPQQERQYKLSMLFEQLEKSGEELLIDNRRDTLLTCKEGTSLLIPAGSLGGSSGVTINIREYYKKSDFVLNQLTATSNKNQLISGGMLHITASVDGSPVDVQPGKPIQVFMTDTSTSMQQMQLFKGEKTNDRLPAAIIKLNEKMEDVSQGYASAYINWVPQFINFGRPFSDGDNTEVKVLDLRNDPIRTRETKRGTVGIFAMAPDAVMSRSALKTALKEKYDYAKVKIRKTRGLFGKRSFGSDGNSIGDSAWIPQGTAGSFGLSFRTTRVPQQNKLLTLTGGRAIALANNADTALAMGNVTTVSVIAVSNDLLKKVKNRYGVNVSSLGWINCDRFYNDPREKTDCEIQLGDTASNYYTMLVFDKLNATMNGYISGTKVLFSSIPVGEPVTIISIGINRQGKPVCGMQKTNVSKTALQGIQFEPADAATLKSSLSRLD